MTSHIADVIRVVHKDQMVVLRNPIHVISRLHLSVATLVITHTTVIYWKY